MKLLNQFFPVYLIENFYVVDKLEKKKLTKIIVENSKYIPINSANYKIPNNIEFFINLYDKFYNICLEKFSFTPTIDNTNQCYAYVNNKNFFKSFIHNHIRTATINSVYYLNVPDKKSGNIVFYHNSLSFSYQPKNFDLLIFPNHLNHCPYQNKKKEWRISINMEIKANDSSDNLFYKLKK